MVYHVGYTVVIVTPHDHVDVYDLQIAQEFFRKYTKKLVNCQLVPIKQSKDVTLRVPA